MWDYRPKVLENVNKMHILYFQLSYYFYLSLFKLNGELKNHIEQIVVDNRWNIAFPLMILCMVW